MFKFFFFYLKFVVNSGFWLVGGELCWCEYFVFIMGK